MNRGREAKIVTVFGSGRLRADDPRYVEAQQLGAALATKGFRVCSGYIENTGDSDLVFLAATAA